MIHVVTFVVLAASSPWLLWISKGGDRWYHRGALIFGVFDMATVLGVAAAHGFQP